MRLLLFIIAAEGDEMNKKSTRTATNIVTSDKTVKTGIKDKKMTKTRIRRKHTIESSHEGRIIVDSLT